MNNNLYMSSLLKAFDVLDCFQDDKQELGISDIAVLVGMPVSSVHRLIQSLEYEGMLIQNRENKKYSLGSKLMSMSVKCRTSRSFGRIASKYVDQLGQLTGETVNLSTCSGDRIINVYHAESHFVLRPNFPLYTSYPAYKTGVGRVFLSWMGDPALKWIYENNKDDISMTQEEFLAMLHQARRDGYALDDPQLRNYYNLTNVKLVKHLPLAALELQQVCDGFALVGRGQRREDPGELRDKRILRGGGFCVSLLAEQVADGAAEVLGQKLHSLNGGDSSSSRELSQQIFPCAALGTGYRGLDALYSAIRLYILHKSLYIHYNLTLY